MDIIVESIAAFATSTRYEDIPDDVRVVARQHIIDSLGCAVGGFRCEASELALTLAPGAPADDFTGAVMLTQRKTSADMAGFINTAMIRYLDFNDAFPSSHPSDCIGGLIAVAGARGSSSAAFVLAVVISYEVHNRLTESARMRWKGWDQGSGVAIAVAAGLASLLDLTLDQARHAIALAAVQCVPLRATRAGQLSLWKGAATADAVREAIFLTGLAQRGMTGPEEPFTGRHGHWEQITGRFDLRAFPSRDGGEYLLQKTRLKYWPLEYNIQIAVWAALELRRELELASVASVTIGTYWSAWHETGSEPEKWHPTTRETADHSMPYLFTAAWRDGIIDEQTFRESSYLDPETVALMARITVEVDQAIEDQYPEVVGIKVQVRTDDGRLVVKEVANPRGHEHNRMTRAETDRKFKDLGSEVLGTERSEKVLTYLWGLGASEVSMETVLKWLQPLKHDPISRGDTRD